MCGIAGIVTGDKERIGPALQAMTRAMAHRGPDGEGVEVLPAGNRQVGFGHRRLAIIDLSPSGRQPMRDPDTGNWITFNGELYNFREIRHNLESRGVAFRTRTDTEVILKAYAVWGKACLERLHGIFAFGLWDLEKQTLLLARDHLGVKPLYLWHEAGTFLFASEVRAILASGFVPRKLDTDGVMSYLAYGSVQEPITLISGIRSLPAAHRMEWSDGSSRVERYWNIPSPSGERSIGGDEAAAKLSLLLCEVVSSQLVADVPVGAFLSGGIDSTSIAALMKKAGGTVKTFSIVFEEKAYDERYYSRLAAEHIGTEHTEILLTSDEVHQDLSDALDSFDQPSADGLNTWYVARAARRAGLTVALSGVGADELFGGYEGYRKAVIVDRFGKVIGCLPSALKSTGAGLLGRISWSEPLRKAAALLGTNRHPYFVTRRYFSEWQIDELLNPGISRSYRWEEEAFDRLDRESSVYDPMSRASFFELQTYMRSTLLRDTDQMSMAHALEVRVPLIDHRLVEFLFTLPGSKRVDSSQPKPLLVRPLKGLIPQGCIYRPKRGFEFPFQVWLNQLWLEEIRETMGDTNRGSQSGLFSGEGINRLWDSFESGRVNWSRVWAVYVLERWLRVQRIDCG